MKNHLIDGWGNPIPKNLFRSIVGFTEIKRYFLQALKSPKTVNIGLVGPPACAKTIFLEELETHLGGTMILGGDSTTNIGLLDVIQNDKPKILLIDEIEKSKNLGVILGWAWSGRVIITKHEKRFDIRSPYKKWFVVWAANNISKMPIELKSRFQIFQFPPYNQDSFYKVCTHYLPISEGITKELSQLIANELTNERIFNIREAVYYARLIYGESDPKRALMELMQTKRRYTPKYVKTNGGF